MKKNNKCINCNKEIGEKAIRCKSCRNRYLHKSKGMGMYGKKQSYSTKEKIGKKNKLSIKRLWENKDYRNHMIKVHTGKITREESKIKQSEAHLGDKNYNWKGGLREQDGYLLRYSPNHPYAGKRRKAVFEHRLIIEKKIGRILKPGEVVHHKDTHRMNNSEGNLQLLNSESEHRKIHWTMKNEEKD